MNTILDVNIALMVPLGYQLYADWNKVFEKVVELEKKYSATFIHNNFIYLKVEKTLEKIFLKDIIFIESLKNYIKVKTINGEVIAYKSISTIENELPSNKFLRVHRSFIISIDFIKSFSPNRILLQGITIPIGRKYKQKVKENLGYF
ncbi:LytTR family DNA-binding domain-containing protein [Muricauda sp. ANG21]|uniref:LytR/AlgR family response regulator transcription factor n=1 Tax=Allomuricauda sp. ANG21 TaxID=3042468 RepID=UPI003452F963